MNAVERIQLWRTSAGQYAIECACGYGAAGCQSQYEAAVALAAHIEQDHHEAWA